MTTINKIIAKVISLVVLAACITILFTSISLARRDEAIYPSNTEVGGIAIANLNHTQAYEKLKAEMGRKWGNKLQLKIDNNAIYAIPLSELKITYNLEESLEKADQNINRSSALSLNHSLIRGSKMNIAPVIKIADESLLYNKLAELKKKLDIPATDARVLYTQGYLEYVEHKNGKAIDLEVSLVNIKAALAKGSLGPVHLVTKNLYPQVRIEDIKSITDLIGVNIISLPAGQNEAGLKDLLACLNGTIVMPDGQFSWQKIISKKADQAELNQTSAAQYLPIVTEGIVNTCRSAQLQMISSEPGGLIFVNSLGKPIMLSLLLQENSLEIKIFGCQTEAGKEISLIKEQSIISPEDTVEVDPTLKSGEKNVIAGQAGRIVRTYRIVKINGTRTEKKLLSEEVIPPVNTIIRVSPDTIMK